MTEDNNVISLHDFSKRQKPAKESSREAMVQRMSRDLVEMIESKLAYDNIDLRNVARLNIAAMLMALLVFETAKEVGDVTDDEIAAAVHRVAGLALRELYKFKTGEGA